MKEKKSNRTRLIGIRLNQEEYTRLEKKWKSSTCRKLSAFLRACIFNRPLTTTYRNRSQDDLLLELTALRKELNALGNNLNQSVKKLHTLHQISDFKQWFLAWENDRKAIQDKIESARLILQKIAMSWLQ